MQSDTQPAPVSKWMLWTGWIVSILPVLALLMSGVMKILKTQDAVEGFTKLGWPVGRALPLGIVEIGCTLTYLCPRTAVLGAILLTGYLGSAVATHVRMTDQEFDMFYAPIILGVLAWGGLWLRDGRVRALAPLRS